ncbi:MAG: 1-acyl-sn-glycerol-3-phosphate acyltransferase [Burkholderiales bacterium]|nr:1-acyl-sn-glycerol-3-phosphate acyltransferase [Burkholderiales bacterium]
MADTTSRVRLGMGGRLGAALLRFFGWRLVDAPPPHPKSVIIVYPHTSNWDFPLGVAWRSVAGLRCHFVAKDTLFRGWFGTWLRRVGGIPVNRRERTGFIGQLLREFESRDEFHVAFTPEGTRSRTEYWKSGFYRLALAAKVPLGLGWIDYAHKELGVGAWLDLTGDEETDLARIRAVYAGRHGKHPEQEGPIRFEPEDQTAARPPKSDAAV